MIVEPLAGKIFLQVYQETFTVMMSAFSICDVIRRDHDANEWDAVTITETSVYFVDFFLVWYAALKTANILHLWNKLIKTISMSFCNSMPLGARRAYYGKVRTFLSAA